MAEKKSKEFKKQFYIKWHPSDWLNDPHVRSLPEGPKAFWIDLLCQMTLFFPFGHCSKLSIKKLRENKNLPSLKRLGVESLVNQNSNQEDNLWVQLSLHAVVDDQLKVATNMEDDLHKFLPYTAEKVKEYIEYLENENVVSRTSNGILYSRRLHKDFRKQVQAHLNGKNGGNPNITGKKPAKSKVNKELDNNKLDTSVNQNINQQPKGEPISGDNHLSNYNYPYNYSPLGQGIKEGMETIKGADRQDYLIQDILMRPWEEIKMFTAICSKITEPDFENWKRFVRFCFETPGFREHLFVGKFPNPADFTEIVHKHQFTREKWLPVLSKLIAGGVKPEHALYYRIPEYIGYTYKSRDKANSLDTGGDDFSGQQGW